MGLFDGIFRESAKSKYPDSRTTEKAEEKIAILLNTRVVKSNLNRQQQLHMSKVVIEKMLYYVALPYQICDCSYIGEVKAWALYNWNNKQVLKSAISEINDFLATVKDLEGGMLEKIVPTDYCINFDSICFDYHRKASPSSLPQSYILYTPETKTRKKSQYPLVAFFNTISDSPDDHCGENYVGELYYAITGEVAKATVYCRKRGRFSEFNFSVIGRTFMISTIRMLNKKTGKVEPIYDCTWPLTDYIDFADDE